MSNDMIIERIYDAILDRKSTAIYGDERDRLHWYETIAVAASVQWTLIPWALAVLAILDAERFGPALWVLFGCHFVPVTMSNAYVARRKVSPVRYDNAKAISTTALIVMPLAVFFLAMIWPSGGPDLAFAGGLVGGAVGLVGVIVWGVVRTRRAS